MNLNKFPKMIYLRPLFAVLFTPIRWLSNLLLRRQNNLIELHFAFDKASCNIDVLCNKDDLNDNLLISSYILFLARYFYICDERQTQVIQKVFASYLQKDSVDSRELTRLIFDDVFKALNELEQGAVTQLFSLGIFSVPFPPLTYSKEKKPFLSHLAKYSLLVFGTNDKKHGPLCSNFIMSAGPDIVLLPLSVGIFYQFVSDELKNKNNVLLLNKSITALIESHNTVSCRSMAGLYKLPNTILKQFRICCNEWYP